MNWICEILKRGSYGSRLLILTSILIGLTAQAQITPGQSAAVHQGTILNLKPGEVLLNRGHWTSQLVDGYNCIQFRGDGSESWNISKCFEVGTFELQAAGVAMLTREAGTLILNGELGPESGEGRYSYTADRRYNRYLNRHFDSEEVEFTLPLFLGNMETDFMDFLSDHYGDLEAEQVTELALHDVSRTDFEDYLTLYREFGSQDPILDQIVTTKINGINRQYVEELQQSGYQDLNLEQMMQAKAHGIDQELIAGLEAAGYEEVPLDLLLKARASGLSVETAQLLTSISQDAISLETVIEMHNRGIHQGYITELQRAGFRNLGLQQVVKAKAMDVDADFVEALNAAELEADFDEVLLAKAATVDTAFVNAFAATGLQGVGLDELVVAKRIGVTFDQVEVWNELGSGAVTFEELLQAQMLDISADNLEAFRSEGVEVFSLAELISASLHGVDVDFVRQVKGLPTIEAPDTTAVQQDNELDELVSEDTIVDPTEDMTQAIARAQEALLGTSSVDQPAENHDAEEGEGEFPNTLHQYISLKLKQDALSAQETLELKQQAEEVDQEAEDRGFYQLDL